MNNKEELMKAEKAVELVDENLEQVSGGLETDSKWSPEMQQYSRHTLADLLADLGQPDQPEQSGQSGQPLELLR